MRLALGMMVHHDLHWLRLHLPVYAYRFDGIIMVVETIDERDDLTWALFDILPGYTGEVVIIVHEFKNDWSANYNHIIEQAEHSGTILAQSYDAIVRLDPDEAVFERDIDAIRSMLEIYSILCFARINYWQDRLHYTPGFFPDWQARAWKLNKGIRLGGQHHEGIGWTKYGMYEGGVDDAPREVLRVPSVQIHHYGNVGKERLLERDLFYLNLDRQKAGLSILTERPADRAYPTRHSVPYHAPQPIDPQAIGIFAPYQE